MPITALTLPFSTLTGLRARHLPSGNFWNEPQGALLVWALTAVEAKKAEATAVKIEKCLIMEVLGWVPVC